MRRTAGRIIAIAMSLRRGSRDQGAFRAARSNRSASGTAQRGDAPAPVQDTTRRALTDRHGAGFWLNRRDPMRLFVDRPYLDEAIDRLFATA